MAKKKKRKLRRKAIVRERKHRKAAKKRAQIRRPSKRRPAKSLPRRKRVARKQARRRKVSKKLSRAKRPKEKRKRARKVRKPRRVRRPQKVKKARRKLLAYLLSFSYQPQGKRNEIRADFIVAGNASFARRDPVEVFGILIEKVIRELPVGQRWIARIAEHAYIEGDGEVDSSVERKTRPPKRAKIRSAYRGETLLYGSDSSEEE
jgi:hypothetical protein